MTLHLPEIKTTVLDNYQCMQDNKEFLLLCHWTFFGVLKFFHIKVAYYCQLNYVEDFLQEANMHDNKGVLTPMSVANPLIVGLVDLTVHGSFLWTIVGKLQYFSFTILYIAFKINKLFKLMIFFKLIIGRRLNGSFDTSIKPLHLGFK